MEPNTPPSVQADQQSPDSSSSPANSIQFMTLKKEYKGLKRILLLLLILSLIASGVGAYLWRDNQANNQKAADAAKIKTLEDKISTVELVIGPITQEMLDSIKKQQSQNSN